METYNPKKDLIAVENNAQEHFAKIVKELNVMGIRLTLTPSGCAGFSYNWEIATHTTDADVLIFDNEIKIWTNYSSLSYLKGSNIAYKTGLGGGQIQVTSPKIENSCGCGESVTFKEL